jgi:hypothetical protein
MFTTVSKYFAGDISMRSTSERAWLWYSIWACLVHCPPEPGSQQGTRLSTARPNACKVLAFGWLCQSKQAVDKRCLVAWSDAEPMTFLPRIASPHAPRVPSEPGCRETLDFPVSAEPGWRTFFAPREPGPNVGTGNQTSGCCIPWAWLSCMQPTKQALCEDTLCECPDHYSKLGALTMPSAVSFLIKIQSIIRFLYHSPTEMCCFFKFILRFTIIGLLQMYIFFI